MIQKLRRRFVAITMGIVFLMLVLIFVLVLVMTHQRLSDDSLKMMQNMTDRPFDDEKHPDRFDGRTLEKEEFRLPFVRILLNDKGEILKTEGNFYDTGEGDVYEPILSRVLALGNGSGVLPDVGFRYLLTPAGFRFSPEHDAASVSTLSEKNGENTGMRVLVLADISRERSAMLNLMRVCSVIGAVSLVLFFLIALVFARWAVKPVEKAWEQQKQFVSDASHELKTPLTVILTNAELMCRPGADEKKIRQFAENILTTAGEMRGLVESLLALARVDSGALMKTVFSEFSMSALLERELMSFEVLFFENGLLLESTVKENLRLYGSESHIRQVIDILLDNAGKYAKSGSTVRCVLTEENGGCRLEVDNAGEAIAPAELKNIFKRFYRLEESRSMEHSYGLGLAIADGIVHAHRGKIWAESDNGRNRFIVTLPFLPKKHKGYHC